MVIGPTPSRICTSIARKIVVTLVSNMEWIYSAIMNSSSVPTTLALQATLAVTTTEALQPFLNRRRKLSVTSLVLGQISRSLLTFMRMGISWSTRSTLMQTRLSISKPISLRLPSFIRSWLKMEHLQIQWETAPIRVTDLMATQVTICCTSTEFTRSLLPWHHQAFIHKTFTLQTKLY